MAGSQAGAQVRGSANYAVDAEGLESAFEEAAASTNYAVSASVDFLGGSPESADASTVSRHGFKGSLYEVRSLELDAAPDPVAETQDAQLSGTARYDDDTTCEVPGSEITGWSMDSGPLTGIDLLGIATSGPVFEDTPAAFSGSYRGIAGAGELMVQDTDTDNYLAYGGDGLDDGFQVQFFGAPPNADAAPGADPDADGQDNAFEELAGFSPLDGSAFLDVRITALSGGTAHLVLNKALPGRDYIIKAGTGLDAYGAIGTVNVAVEEADLEVEDPNVSEARKFYKVEIINP